MQVFTLPEGKDFEKHATVVWGDGKNALIQLLTETRLYSNNQFRDAIFPEDFWTF